MPEFSPEKKYEGPPPSPQNFAASYSEIASMVRSAADRNKQTYNVLDPDSQRNLEDLRVRMRMSPPKPATVVNILPWQLSVTSDIFCRGIVVPACPPGTAFSYHHIRGYKHFWKDNEDCTSKLFFPILAIELAREFLRACGDLQRFGGGVIVYEGEKHPDKVGMIESYDNAGSPLRNEVMGKETTPEGDTADCVLYEPIMVDFNTILREGRQRRNDAFFLKIQAMNQDWLLPNGLGKRNLTQQHILMAEVLLAEGRIEKKPDWCLSSRIEAGLEEDNCPACGAPRKSNTYKCSNCNRIIDPFAAYMDADINIEHNSMAKLSAEQWVKVNEEEERRSRAKEAGEKRKAKKPE